MNVLIAIIFGLVQGITEFLPVSSSGHLTLFGRLFEVDETAMLSFTTLLHMGTLIAVFVVMRKEIGQIIRDIFGRRTWLLVIATIPAIIAAVLLGDFLDTLFAGGYLGYSFLLTAVILLVSLVRKPPQQSREINTRDALVGGFGQAIAILPGVSRSGSTITALLLSGIDRDKAIRFSFLMSIPAILGGFAKDIYDLVKDQDSSVLSLGIGNIIIGVLAAAISGYLVMEFMLRKLNRKGFVYCAVYVAILGILVIVDQTATHIVF